MTEALLTTLQLSPAGATDVSRTPRSPSPPTPETQNSNRTLPAVLFIDSLPPSPSFCLSISLSLSLCLCVSFSLSLSPSLPTAAYFCLFPQVASTPRLPCYVETVVFCVFCCVVLLFCCFLFIFCIPFHEVKTLSLGQAGC